jgi:hypothetical protein
MSLILSAHAFSIASGVGSISGISFPLARSLVVVWLLLC